MSEFSRNNVTVLEVDIDTCLNVYGVAPCTAGRKHTGTAQAGGASTITLAASASGADSAYNNMIVRLTGGTGSGQERTITAYVGATRVATVSVAWTPAPDATSVYAVIDRPNACYNTFRTCQDRPNYLRGTKTFKFMDRGAPIPAGEALRPYLSSIKFAPTEIDPDAGVARRASVSLTAADETDSDIETDPYVAARTAKAQGTFWARFFSRVHNYSGRPARIKRAYLTGAWNWADFTTELYQIEAMKGPSARGEVGITLKDPLKIADRVKLPAPSGGKLGAALANNDLRLVLRLGDGTQYSPSGYVRVGDQIIRYTRKQVENGWNFTNNTLDGFTATNATLASGADTMTVTPTAIDPQIRVVANIYGYKYRYIIARLRRNIGQQWEGAVIYTTAQHGESSLHYKNIGEPAGIASGYVLAVWDMHALTAGGTDWQTNTILGVRLDLTNITGTIYEIDWIGWSETATLDENVLTLPDSTYRSQFGTTAVAQKIGDGVQQCLVYVDQPFSTVVQNLLNTAGITNANIDLAVLQSEDSTWLGSRYRITAALSEPEDVSVYLGELALQSGGVLWWSPTAQKVKYKFIGPASPAAVTGNTFTDAANIVDGSMQVEPLDNLRKTFVSIYYELYSATANRKEAKNYTRGEIYIDTDAEGANEYSDRRVEINYSRWFSNVNSLAMDTWVRRRLGQYRDAPKKLDFKIDPKDAVVAEGDLYDITTAALTGFNGAPLTVRCLIVKRMDNSGDISITARSTNFSRRYGFIAPNGTGNYPNNSGYACVSSAAGAMADGTRGYLVI